MDELSSSSDNYDIPTPKNDSGNSSESEATLINEKNSNNNENYIEDEEPMKIEKSIHSEIKSKKEEEQKIHPIKKSYYRPYLIIQIIQII